MALADPLPRPAQRALVEECLAHLLGLIGADGRFVYAHPMHAADQARPGYNLLRHCGTLWFMLRAVNQLGLALPDRDRLALGRAVGYAARKFRRPAWISVPTLALVTKGAVKTGGVGLALLMLGEYRRGADLPQDATSDTLDDTISALAAYGRAQREGQDFLHKRRFDDGTVLPFRSGYYTGELLFGLFATGTADAAVLAAAEALMARRYGVAEQSHWMAYAACEAAGLGLLDRAPLTGYLADLIGDILANPAYRARRASTPIGCRAEALTRFVRLCDDRPGWFPPPLRAAALQAADEDLALLLHWYDRGQFCKDDTSDKVQIDYIQHNATAFLNRWLCGEAAPGIDRSGSGRHPFDDRAPPSPAGAAPCSDPSA
jgi:hypothetical protein